MPVKSGRRTVSRPNGGCSGEGQVRLSSDVSMLDWIVVTAERIPAKSYRWYVNGGL
jgi:hypothetical protein